MPRMISLTGFLSARLRVIRFILVSCGIRIYSVSLFGRYVMMRLIFAVGLEASRQDKP